MPATLTSVAMVNASVRVCVCLCVCVCVCVCDAMVDHMYVCASGLAGRPHSGGGTQGK